MSEGDHQKAFQTWQSEGAGGKSGSSTTQGSSGAYVRGHGEGAEMGYNHQINSQHGVSASVHADQSGVNRATVGYSFRFNLP